MITDQSLMKIALIMVIVGIILLFLITIFIGTKEMTIGNVDERAIGQIIEIKGTVNSYFTKDGHVFMNINDGDEIQVVIFEKDAKVIPIAYEIKNGDNLSLEGKVQLYKDELELVVSSLKRI